MRTALSMIAGKMGSWAKDPSDEGGTACGPDLSSLVNSRSQLSDPDFDLHGSGLMTISRGAAEAVHWRPCSPLGKQAGAHSERAGHRYV